MRWQKRQAITYLFPQTIKRRVRLGQRNLNLLVAWSARPVICEDYHRKCFGKEITKARQQIQAGVGAERHVKHHHIDALGGQRATGALKRIRRNHVCGRTERMSHQREHIVIVVYMENAQTSGLLWSKRDAEDLNKMFEIQWLAEPIQNVEMG